MQSDEHVETLVTLKDGDSYGAQAFGSMLFEIVTDRPSSTAYVSVQRMATINVATGCL